MIQRSLVLLKPDAVKRGIVGEILHRFERAGLKIVGAKFLLVDESLGSKHYKHANGWQKIVGQRGINDCKKYGCAVLETFGTSDPVKIGQLVDKRNAVFLASGPIFAMVLDGPNAVAKIRSLVGSTFPDMALPGTIRGDYGLDSAYSGMVRKRTTYNMIHASGNVEEAEQEINLWFKLEELVLYKRIHEDLYSY